jgi:large subunit ribosomal protein L9
VAGNVEVILQENYPQLGFVGDQVRVRAGFARNFLVPRGIAVPLSSRQGKSVRHAVAAIQAKRSRLRKEAQDEVSKMEAVRLAFTLKFGEHGKSFGSITNRDIAAALTAEGMPVDRKQVRIPEPIKTAGEHTVEVRLHSEVAAHIVVDIAAEKAPRAARAAAKEDAAEKESPSDDSQGEESQNAEAEVEEQD